MYFKRKTPSPPTLALQAFEFSVLFPSHPKMTKLHLPKLLHPTDRAPTTASWDDDLGKVTEMKAIWGNGATRKLDLGDGYTRAYIYKNPLGLTLKISTL